MPKRYQLIGMWGMVERQYYLTKRYLLWEVVWLCYGLVNSLAIAFIGAGMERISGVSLDVNYIILYLLIGTLIWCYLAGIFDVMSETVAWERWEGTIEYTFMAPISRITHLAGMGIYATLYGVIRTLVILFVVAMFFNISLRNANIYGSIVTLLIATISFLGFGMVAAVLPLISPEKGVQMTYIIQAAILLISGVYYPVDVLPSWMQFLARFSPATYALAGMRKALLENATVSELWPYNFPLILIGLVSVPAGLLVFEWAEAHAKRTGKLKRSG
jgi:ABC-2 type transport system permease protein